LDHRLRPRPHRHRAGSLRPRGGWPLLPPGPHRARGRQTGPAPLRLRRLRRPRGRPRPVLLGPLLELDPAPAPRRQPAARRRRRPAGADRRAAARPSHRRLPYETPPGLAARRRGGYTVPGDSPGDHVNPLQVLPLLAYTIAAVLWPTQVDAHRRGRMLLVLEALILVALHLAGHLLAGLAVPSASGLHWGMILLVVTGYLYVCGRGVVLVRAALELPALQMRRDEDRTAGAIEVSRGRMIGVLERALALTLVLLGQYAALGLIVAAKSLARFKALEDREF